MQGNSSTMDIGQMKCTNYRKDWKWLQFTLIKQDIKVVLTALKTATNDGFELQDDRQIPWMQ